MSYSNYPPGVNGSEYPIAGAEREVAEEVTCPECELTVTADVSYYQGSRWYTCPACGADVEDEDDGIDFPDPSDD